MEEVNTQLFQKSKFKFTNYEQCLANETYIYYGGIQMFYAEEQVAKPI